MFQEGFALPAHHDVRSNRPVLGMNRNGQRLLAG